ncbi:MAG: RNA-binding protein hfq [Cyanobacteria bacterium P01_A01_bin.105]
MATDFETGIPSIRQVQMLIRDQQGVEVKLTTGDVINGNVRWQDQNAVCVESEGQTLILMRGAIAYIKA